MFTPPYHVNLKTWGAKRIIWFTVEHYKFEKRLAKIINSNFGHFFHSLSSQLENDLVHQMILLHKRLWNLMISSSKPPIWLLYKSARDNFTTILIFACLHVFFTWTSAWNNACSNYSDFTTLYEFTCTTSSIVMEPVQPFHGFSISVLRSSMH
jgi:hypothetical protein